MWLKHFQIQSDKNEIFGFTTDSQLYQNYSRNMKTMRTFFHCTVSQKEALEINRFSDNSWMNWTFLYIGQEKTKVVGGRLVTVPAHKICTMVKFSKFCPKIIFSLQPPPMKTFSSSEHTEAKLYLFLIITIKEKTD